MQISIRAQRAPIKCATSGLTGIFWFCRLADLVDLAELRQVDAEPPEPSPVPQPELRALDAELPAPNLLPQAERRPLAVEDPEVAAVDLRPVSSD